jgi:endonuclease G
MIKKILLSSSVIVALNATDISDFIDLNNCDQIIDKQIFKICYSYKYKGALAVWYELDGKFVNKNNIKNRPDFYSEKNIPIEYRTKSQDYINSGFDRGHLAPDANFDYDPKTQAKTYSMVNIVPQSPTLNRKAWIKAERYERLIANKLNTTTVINLIDYSKSTTLIGKSKLSVPNTFYKIIFNDDKNFKKCFKYENIEIDPGTDKLRNHQITC